MIFDKGQRPEIVEEDVIFTFGPGISSTVLLMNFKHFQIPILYLIYIYYIKFTNSPIPDAGL